MIYPVLTMSPFHCVGSKELHGFDVCNEKCLFLMLILCFFSLWWFQSTIGLFQFQAFMFHGLVNLYFPWPTSFSSFLGLQFLHLSLFTCLYCASAVFSGDGTRNFHSFPHFQRGPCPSSWILNIAACNPSFTARILSRTVVVEGVRIVK